MKIGIMQPYFCPYIGYFQLINYVDRFVIYDEIQYTKKGWINRNRILQNGEPAFFTLPLKKESDFLQVKERKLAEGYFDAANKICRRVESLYKKAPFFEETLPIVKKCLFSPFSGLFEVVFVSIQEICDYLEIKTPLFVSSVLSHQRDLKGKEMVLDIVKVLQGDEYVNPIGGVSLYEKDFFRKEGVKLSFLRSTTKIYEQFGAPFVPFLSILDTLFFCGKTQTIEMLKQFTLE